jgi:hypothetical protein
MLTISGRHASAFASKAEQDFHLAALAHIRENFPVQTAGHPDGALLTLIREAQASSESYGLVTQRQIVCFLDSTILLGPGFIGTAEHAWTEDMLKTPDLDPDEKAARLLKEACDYRQAQDGKGW